MAVTTLRKSSRGGDQDQREPELAAREALAAGIAEMREAERTADAAKKAVERAKGMFAAAQACLEEATAAVALARDRLAADAVAAARSGEVLMPDRDPMREAMARQASAADDELAAKAALIECERAIENPSRELVREQEKVAALADLVLMTATSKVMVECERARAEFRARHSALLYVQRLHYEPFTADHGEQYRAIERVLSAPAFGSYEHPGAAAWEQARQALQRGDPDVVLPT